MSKMITEQQLAVLSKEQSSVTLVEWWKALNNWEWVDALGPAEEIPKEWTPNTQRHEIMSWIERKVGMEYILRVCNVLFDKRMTHDEFTEWWGRHGNH